MIDEHDNPTELLAKIHDSLESGGLDPDDRLPFLTLILAIPITETTKADPGLAKPRIYETVLDLIATMAAQKATILSFNDLLLADTSSWAFSKRAGIKRNSRSALSGTTWRPSGKPN